MSNWNRFWRKLTAYMVTKTPLGSYGKLVLHPVTILEQVAGAEIAFSTAHYKK